MEVPKVRFVYSGKYHNVISNLSKNQHEKDIPEGKILKHASEMQNEWNIINDNVMQTLSDVSTLEWKENEISCYILPNLKSFSDPMTIRLTFDWEEEKWAITHELIHRLLTQNNGRLKLESLYSKFSDEMRLTKAHILVHAILSVAYARLFVYKTLEKYIEEDKKLAAGSAYARAWDIVNEHGAEKLIEEFIMQ